MTYAATPGVKMQYLIRRRPGVTRDELVAHWFANHMPGVVRAMEAAKSAGKLHANRYHASLFDPPTDAADCPWDGVAQLWWAEQPPAPAQPYGTVPADSFQEKAEPYLGWATREHVVVDGTVPTHPLTLNAPFPCTRTGFTKIYFFVIPKPGIDHQELFTHWADVHAPNVAKKLHEVGGLRYAFSHSIDPASAPYAGTAELWFPSDEAWTAFITGLPSDGIERWIERLEVRTCRTEMIGIL